MAIAAPLAADAKLPACANARESGLPLPSTFSKYNNPAAYQKLLSDFLVAGHLRVPRLVH
jgi:hypothetical protein